MIISIQYYQFCLKFSYFNFHYIECSIVLKLHSRLLMVSCILHCYCCLSLRSSKKLLRSQFSKSYLNHKPIQLPILDYYLNYFWKSHYYLHLYCNMEMVLNSSLSFFYMQQCDLKQFIDFDFDLKFDQMLFIIFEVRFVQKLNIDLNYQTDYQV